MRLAQSISHRIQRLSRQKKRRCAIYMPSLIYMPNLFYMLGLRTYCFIASGRAIKRRAISSIGKPEDAAMESDANRILINGAGFLFRCAWILRRYVSSNFWHSGDNGNRLFSTKILKLGMPIFFIDALTNYYWSLDQRKTWVKI